VSAAVRARARRAPRRSSIRKTLTSPRLASPATSAAAAARSYMFQHLRREKSPEFAAIQDLWPVLFSEVSPDPPPDLLTWCCAQFIVSRAAIRRLSLAHWRRLYDWILSEEMRRLRSGVIMEHAWPVMLDQVKHEVNVEPCDLLNCTEFERLRDILAADGGG
jgi:hypothetical protein